MSNSIKSLSFTEKYEYNKRNQVVKTTNVLKQGTAYTYDAFGSEQNPDTSDANPFRYSGEYRDAETGTIGLCGKVHDSGKATGLRAAASRPFICFTL